MDCFVLEADLIRFVAFVPFNPVSPHLNNIFFFKLSGNGEPCDRVDVGVEVFPFLKLGEVLLKSSLDEFLEVLDFGEFAVGDAEWVITNHLINLIMMYHSIKSYLPHESNASHIIIFLPAVSVIDGSQPVDFTCLHQHLEQLLGIFVDPALAVSIIIN